MPSVHTFAGRAEDTDRSQIVRLYDRLLTIDASPLVRLNRAVAVAELDGPQPALADVDRLGAELAEYHAFCVTRADLLRSLGRADEARSACNREIDLADNPAERAHLVRRVDDFSR